MRIFAKTLIFAAALLALPSIGRAQDDVPKGYSQVSFNVLSGYDWDMPDPLDPTAKVPKNEIPASVKLLDGKPVYLKGFMLPLDLDAQGVSKFMLNASIDMCYFGAPVRLNDWIMVTMKPGKKAKFTHLPTAVWGRLEVGEEIRNGRTVSIYRLVADDAKTDGS